MTILIVDDEPMMLRYLDTILQGDGYEVLLADGGDEALVVCKSAACCFDLMITDVAMPRMSGRVLADCMNLRHPTAPIIFMSGYPKSREILADLTGRDSRMDIPILESHSRRMNFWPSFELH